MKHKITRLIRADLFLVSILFTLIYFNHSINFTLSRFRQEVTDYPELAFVSSAEFGSIFTLEWKKDNRAIAIGGDGAYIYLLEDDEILRLEGNLVYFTSVSWSPNDSKIAGAAQSVVVWDANSGDLLTTLAEEYRYRWYTGIAWSFQSNIISAVSWGLDSTDYSINIWEGDTGKLIRIIQDTNPITAPPDSFGETGFSSLDINPAGDTIATTTLRDNRIRTWDIATGEALSTLASHDTEMLDVIFSPDGSKLVSNSYDNDTFTVIVWDIVAEQPTERFESNHIGSVSWHPNGNLIAIAAKNGVSLWNIDTDSVETIEINNARNAKWSLDGTMLAIVAKDGIHILDTSRLTD